MTIQYSTIQNPAKRYCNINDIALHELLRVDTIHHSAIYQIEVHKHILYIYMQCFGTCIKCYGREQKT